MGARFLYGDSEPFPDGFDFLSALRSFVRASSRVLALAYEADELERSLGERAQEHLHALEALQAFFNGLGDVIAERAARSGAPQVVGPYASQLLDQIDALSAKARAARAKDLDADQVEVAARIRARRSELRAALAEYLVSEPLPVDSWALSLGLGGTAPQGQVVRSHPGDLTTSFSLDVSRDASWGRPRKIGDFAPGLALQVGFKKAFLRSSLHPDVVVLDEMMIAALELGPDSMEIHLRRKLDAPRDSFVITLDPEGDELVAKITRFDERSGGGSDAPYASQGDEIARIAELAEALRAECAPLVARKQRLLSAQLDGHDVFERNLVHVLLLRVSERLASVATEVARHSPNPHELSLKLEREDGRREELYLRKSDLVQMVADLPPEAIQLYQRLSFLPLPQTRAHPQSVAPPMSHVDIEVMVEPPRSSSAPPPIPKPSSPPPPPKRKW
ncbi:hypothetical protein [Sandaracinus amylolyticus]|uniref:Uncharacterized protein n=1 Tax=Sandaracinus amylolyticus TaxID=927083 RepID=A0A0F6W246_9BACT|nr:hypothetical protein [Sandaracinus amylolyticus]AKF05467.1 hypothetical protein DB32_002616 [Sandaracinus amylolyticus]